MNLVDEEHAASWHRCEESGQIPRLLDGGAAGCAHLGLHGVAKNVGECRLAESRRAAEQNMLQRFIALPGGLHEKLQALDGALLTAEFLKKRRS